MCSSTSGKKATCTVQRCESCSTTWLRLLWTSAFELLDNCGCTFVERLGRSAILLLSRLPSASGCFGSLRSWVDFIVESHFYGGPSCFRRDTVPTVSAVICSALLSEQQNYVAFIVKNVFFAATAVPDFASFATTMTTAVFFAVLRVRYLFVRYFVLSSSLFLDERFRCILQCTTRRQQRQQKQQKH